MTEQMDTTAASDTESERWEDFFGSSTELAPSLLGFYDNLTSSFDSNFKRNDNLPKSLKEEKDLQDKNNNNNNNNNSNSNNIQHTKCLEENINICSVGLFNDQKCCQLNNDANENSHSLSGSSTDLNSYDPVRSIDCVIACRADNNSRSKSPIGNHSKSREPPSINSSFKHRNNIRVLSPNVQRIITHSDAEPVDSVDIDALQTADLNQVNGKSHLPQTLYTRRVTSSLSAHSNHKLKLSHIPLSKITCKLTQSGNELVETFDSSSEYLDALNFSQSETRKESTLPKANVKKPSTPAAIEVPGVERNELEGYLRLSIPKTRSPFNFESNSLSCSPSQNCNQSLPKTKSDSENSLNLIEMEQLATATQLCSMPLTLEVGKAKEFVPADPPLSPLEVAEAFNLSLISQSINHLSLLDTNDSKNIVETVNKTLISKPLVRSSSAACASTVNGSPLLTYARSKSVATKASTLAVPIKLPTAKQLEELEEASRISAESLDRLTDIKSKCSPNESRKYRGIMLPDIAKLKHRPLSSASICSTSSSSSSGSELPNSKLATNYLASVESLDELLDPHSGMTVSERSLLEIVESERNYVEDLGQVIKGYFLDWKEKACLTSEELKVLFSNIEEIYQFNSTLLKQLEEAGMDPVKISKCFIELSERFDVYTTYCTQYPEAISLLTKLLQATHTNNLLNSTQKALRHTLPLGSYLLKPVQRILKYHLLLDNLRKHFDIKEVFQAHEIMRQVARNIDQVKKKLEQQSRVKELSGILDGWLGPELTVLGELRQEGLLMEHNKPRMVFLFTTMLIITKPKEDNRLQFKSYIHQNNLMLSEHLPGEPTSFYVIPYDEPRNQIKLTAKNRDQKRLWAQHIKGVILEKFDIPSRAKELVYKLGDEEDRTPNKLPRKWTLHSSNSATPTYLERRNQYRRSEMRNRNKFKRKTVATSTSFESFNEIVESINEMPKKSTSLTRNNSMDESALPTLQKFASAVRNKHKSVEISAEKRSENEDSTDNLKGNSSTPKSGSPKASNLNLKQRSKSVPRISFPIDDTSDDISSLKGSKTQLNEKKSSPSKPADVEIRQYNHKTLPKRISTLKKQRQKETSKFYLDLADFESAPETILKITESTESLEPKENHSPASKETELEASKEKEETLTPTPNTKRDDQIILDLLQNKKEFGRFRNKSPKKRAVSSSPITSPMKSPELEEPPRPPSRSPPPLEPENEVTDGQKKTPMEEDDENEPIYESLLRNVHVPYKFSPKLGRSSNSRNSKSQETKLPRPESDYVTLVYTPEGQLQQVGDEELITSASHSSAFHNEASRESSGSCSSESSSETIKRDSQKTVISLDITPIEENFYAGPPSQNRSTEVISTRLVPKNIMKRLLHSHSNKNSMENICASEGSLVRRDPKSSESVSLPLVRNSKLPERRVSDISEMFRQNYFHRQGSEAVGERIAHVDYADPRSLFLISRNTTSEASLQRDSVVSLTSSNDSVCDQNRSKVPSLELSTNFEYEDNVEATLENDFRDSAIYSDDNDKRIDSDNSSPPVGLVNKRLPPPLPPPRTKRYPSLPPKPPHLQQSVSALTQFSGEQSTPRVIMCPPNLSESASRSWVLQQIENFNK